MTKKLDISQAAAALGRKGGASTSPAKRAASAENGKAGGISPKLRKDGSITYWSVYQQVWVTALDIPDAELAAMTDAQRERVIRHIGK